MRKPIITVLSLITFCNLKMTYRKREHLSKENKFWVSASKGFCFQKISPLGKRYLPTHLEGTLGWQEC